MRGAHCLSLMAYAYDFYLCFSKMMINRDVQVLLHTLSSLGIAVNLGKFCLTWWVTSLDGWNGRLLVLPAACEFQLSTDASGSGWRAVLWAHDCLLASGFWDRRVSEESVNYRELLAVYLAFFPFIGCWKMHHWR